MSRIKSSEEITAAADELQIQLAALRKEARKMKKLEEQQAKEEQRKRDAEYALEFVAFAKQLHFQSGSGDSYFDYISKKLAESKTATTQTEQG